MIEVSGLTKKYGSHTAVNNLSFSIEEGHIYGFLGPNGAGKSTTMNIITGCLAATSGQVKIDGFDIFDSPVEAKKRIGYLPEQPPLYPDMTPEEYLLFVAEAKGVKDAKAQVFDVMEKTQITDVSKRLIKNLSKGYKQRVGIAQALIGDPSAIILDEPTVGLDPNQIIEIRSLISELGKKHTIVLSSHILSEVQAVCDRVMIISKGNLVANDTPEKLEALFAGRSTLGICAKCSANQAKEILSEIDGASGVSCRDTGGLAIASVDFSPEEPIAEKVFFAFADKRIPILSMNTERASLEDIFIELTGSDDTVPEEENNTESEENTL
ncbi:MAG: ABC transporter ATP-binding protein [Clostridiales bacterium]|nr:ABC transporter ATP-binding protein [Clostridiales bacterium]